MIKCDECDKELASSSMVTIGESHFCNHLCRVQYEGKVASGQIKPQGQSPKKSDGKVAKMVGFGIAFAVFFVGASFASKKLVEMIQNRIPTAVELNLITSTLNASLPMMLDRETQIKTSIAFDGRIRYVYKLVRLSGDSINKPQLLDFIKKQTSAMSCTSEETRKLINKHVDLEYWYMDKSDKFVVSYVLTKSICDSLK